MKEKLGVTNSAAIYRSVIPLLRECQEAPILVNFPDVEAHFARKLQSSVLAATS